jgi:hypothetical protein
VRCSLLRRKWRTTGRVWVTHRRTLLGWITRTVSSAATQIGVVRNARHAASAGVFHPRALTSGRPPVLPLARWAESHSNVQLDIRWTFDLRTGHQT